MTLIEVLVAMALMALLSVMGYRAFGNLLISRERLMATADEWTALARAFSRVERDLSRLPPGAAGAALRLAEDGALALTADAPNAIDGEETIEYSVREQGLWWASHEVNASGTAWPLLPGKAPLWQVGLSDGRWFARWPLPDGGGRPVAVKLSLPLSDGHRVERVWALP
ncbi:prepilin-type N-terminal cleavage/methylation domain-containing protein [Crenobacter cavernae]|uniref:Prepilin-type N-terminal cleavage/methylation domain-containing protein n=2 Tax=Crenobacter cavernae TaxID=2290923 RepID=A0A345Y9G9_9NEIS|nr:prepilin-type N-terminal cleavage/methylation domain-containing protein [Crenobacter cavernae]